MSGLIEPGSTVRPKHPLKHGGYPQVDLSPDVAYQVYEVSPNGRLIALEGVSVPEDENRPLWWPSVAFAVRVEVDRTGITLNPSDPFEAVLVRMVELNRRKRADYTADGASPWANFDRTEEATGYGFGSAVEVLIATKNSRLYALANSEGEPRNESIEDTYADRAVYGVIAYARYLYPEGKVAPE